MQTTNCDVLIVGAGAAGTMLSLELARYGVDARTVDRLMAPATTSKAITVHARTLEILASIDRRLVDGFLERGIHNRGYVLHFVDGHGNRSEVRPGLDFEGLDSRYQYLLVHGQSETEQRLRDYLREEYGREPDWGVTCIGIENRDDGVVATLENRDGERESVEARYVVACDGMNSAVRRALDLGQTEQDYAGTKMQNLDVFLEGFPDAEDYVHYCAGTDHFIMIVKLPGGFFRLLLSDRGEAADPSIEPKRAFGNLVARHFDDVRLGDVVWHSRWESFVRLAKTYRSGNVFLAGDSAHVHSTTGGQGMNCCIQDAFNLGWKLGLVLRGDAQPTLLDTYERERRPIAEQVIWAASSLHEIFMAHGRDIEERARRMDDPGFHDAVVGHCSGLDYTYRDGSGGAVDPATLTGPVAGDRLVDVTLADGRTLAEIAAGTGFTLIGVGDDAATAAALRTRLDSCAGRFGSAVRTASGVGSTATRARYGAPAGGQVIVVRPDGYIGFRQAGLADSAVDAYLQTRLVARAESMDSRS